MRSDAGTGAGAVQYQIPTVVGSTEITLTVPAFGISYPARTHFSPSTSSSRLSSCARGSHVRNYYRPSIDSFRAGFVVTSERADERASGRADERLSKVGYISSASESRSPVYRVDTTKAGQRRVFDCASRVLQSELTRSWWLASHGER